MRFECSPNGGSIVHHNFESTRVIEEKSKQHFDKTINEVE